MPEFGMLSFFKKTESLRKGDVEKKFPPVAGGEFEDEKDMTLASLLRMIPSVNDSDLMKVMGKSEIIKRKIESNYENFRTAFHMIIKNMDKANLTADDRRELVQSYLNRLEYLEQLVNGNNRDATYSHFSEQIRDLKKKVNARIIQ